MRPLTLKLRGFTSFREDQELSFRGLDVFAITGPTGAGKSSLLDAITYALYGEVERVGRECGQLVTHGMNRMYVTLDFEVNGREYRITRNTPSGSGATKVLLEKIVDGSPQSYGDGADRVRDCSAIITGLLGLDYTGFTRSVLLPQGKFAEFMVGDPKQRRDILSDLLGLNLFRRMAERAGRLARDSNNAASAKRDLLTTEYGEVTCEALDETKRAAEEARVRLGVLEGVSKEVDKLTERWHAEQARAAELKTCATDFRELVGRLEAAVAAIGELDTEFTQHGLDLARASQQVEETVQATNLAMEERAKAEAAWGTILDLARVEPTAARLPALRASVTIKQSELEQMIHNAPILQSDLVAQRAGLDTANESIRASDTELAHARQRLEALEHADMAATLAHGLSAGDPCPVCGEPLARLPEHPGGTAIAEARQIVGGAEKSLQRLKKSVVEVQRQIDTKLRDIQEDEHARQRCGEEIAALMRERETAEQDVSSALRGAAIEEAGSVLAERSRQLKEFVNREQTATKRRDLVQLEHVRMVQAGELLHQRLLHHRGRLEESNAVLVARGSGLLTDRPFQLAPLAAVEARPGELVRFGRARVGALTLFAAELQTQADRSAVVEAALLQQAHASTQELIPLARTLAELVQSLVVARTAAGVDRATANQRAEMLAIRLENRDKLEREVTELREKAAVYQELTTDLRQDRLIAFLQDQALKLLAAAGTRHLLQLSGDRYQLRYNRDFFVVDTWNGDEARNVRTLSGGETFLASLALALALSEQVTALSITERAQLDSLFLDEGFGTLDPESLRMVQEAIEQLGGGGRMVGVITHMHELAENFPRIEIEKTPRGSRLRTIVD